MSEDMKRYQSLESDQASLKQLAYAKKREVGADMFIFNDIINTSGISSRSRIEIPNVFQMYKPCALRFIRCKLLSCAAHTQATIY